MPIINTSQDTPLSYNYQNPTPPLFSSQDIVQRYSQEISLLSKHIKDILSVENTLPVISLLSKESNVLKELYNALPYLQRLDDNLNKLLLASDNVGMIKLISTNLSKFERLYQSINLLESVFNELPALKAIHKRLFDLIDLSNYITTIKAVVEILPTDSEPSVSIEENTWTFKLPRGASGLTPVPKFRFNQVSKKIEYYIEYVEYNPDNSKNEFIELMELDKAIYDAHEFVVDEIVKDVSNKSTIEYLDKHLVNIVKSELYRYINTIDNNIILDFVKHTILDYLKSDGYLILKEYIEKNKDEFKSDIPGPRGFTPIISFKSDVNGDVYASVHYTDDVDPRESNITDDKLFNIYDALTIFFKENNIDLNQSNNQSSTQSSTQSNNQFINQSANQLSTLLNQSFIPLGKPITLGYIQKYAYYSFVVDSDLTTQLPSFIKIVGDVPNHCYITYQDEIIEQVNIVYSSENHSIKIVPDYDFGDEYKNVEVRIGLNALIELERIRQKFKPTFVDDKIAVELEDDILGSLFPRAKVYKNSKFTADIFVNYQKINNKYYAVLSSNIECIKLDNLQIELDFVRLKKFY